MRKHLVWILAFAFAAMTVGIAYAASTANDSTVSMKVTPKTLEQDQVQAGRARDRDDDGRQR